MAVQNPNRRPAGQFPGTMAMGADRRSSSADEPLCGGFCCLATLITIAGFILASVYLIPSRNLYVAIDSVSGLDYSSLPSPSPSTGLDLALSPAFNLTLRVSSGSPGRHACLEARTYMEVSYRCVLLAASAALPGDLCVAPRGSADWHVVARGVGVRLPGFLVDALGADAAAGAEAFDVTLRRAGEHYYYRRRTVASCGVRRAGDAPGKCDAEGNDCPESPAVVGPRCSNGGD